MKLFIRFFLFALIFGMFARAASAQNKYLLLEYIRLRSDITDSSSIIENIQKRLQQQNQKDHSVLQSTMWQTVNPNNKDFQYIVTTVFKNFNDYMSEYKNRDSSDVYYSISKGRLDTVTNEASDSFEVVSTPIFEMLADAGSPNKQPEYLLITKIKAMSGREASYESSETGDWLPIHRDLIKRGYESAFGFNKLIFPLSRSDYNYSTFLFFADEEMFNKQDDIDYQPYMQANQSAFINSGRLHKDVHAELVKFITVLNTEEQK